MSGKGPVFAGCVEVFALRFGDVFFPLGCRLSREI